LAGLIVKKHGLLAGLSWFIVSPVHVYVKLVRHEINIDQLSPKVNDEYCGNLVLELSVFNISSQLNIKS